MRNVTRYVLAVLLAIMGAASVNPARSSVTDPAWQLDSQELATVSDCSLAVKKAVMPQLLQAYTQGDQDMSASAGAALREVGRSAPRAVIEPATRHFRSASADTAAARMRLFTLLSDVASRQDFPVSVLQKALRSSEPRLRQKALWTAADMGPSAGKAAPALLELVDTRDPSTRRHALEALRTVGVRDGMVPRLCSLLHSRHFAVRRFAIDSLAELGARAESAIPKLVSIAEAADGALRADIRRALKHVKTENAAPVVEDADISCAEGGSTVVNVPFAAWDSVPGSLEVSLADGPSYGTVEHRGEGRFVYHSSRGFAGEDTFTCVVSDGEGGSSRARATVSIQPDTEAPSVEEVASGGRPGKLRLIFSEPVRPESAEDVSNYALSPDVDIVRAQLGEYGMTVTLSVSPLSEEQDYELTVRNVADRSAAGNRIAEAHKRLRYYEGDTMGPVVIAEDIEQKRAKPARRKSKGSGDRASLSTGDMIRAVAEEAGPADSGSAVTSAADFLIASWLQEREEAAGSDGT
ncbi:MAG: HEAT repeat domain-containing protein, partial [Planctomycetota bacterium]